MPVAKESLPMAPPGGRRAKTHRLTVWNALLVALVIGALAILAIFKLHMRSVGWKGSFPWTVYASGTAAWGVALLNIIAVLEISGAVRLGAPRAAAVRQPWVPFAAMLLGLALGYLFWK
jgi:hypothetical protein